MKKILTTTFVIVAIILIYNSYHQMKKNIAFERYHRCMIINQDVENQDIALSYCLGKLKN